MMEIEIKPSPIIGGQYLLNKAKHPSKTQLPPTLGGKIAKQPTSHLDSNPSLKNASLASSLDANTRNMQPFSVVGGQGVHGKHRAVKKPEPKLILIPTRIVVELVKAQQCWMKIPNASPKGRKNCTMELP
jgi:hypothetical protein